MRFAPHLPPSAALPATAAQKIKRLMDAQNHHCAEHHGRREARSLAVFVILTLLPVLQVMLENDESNTPQPG
jgi:hypothetical protein